jgi:hypothetical protein
MRNQLIVGMVLSMVLWPGVVSAAPVTKTLDETENGADISPIAGLVSGVLILTEKDKISDVVVFDSAGGGSASLRSDDPASNDAPNGIDVSDRALNTLIGRFTADERVTMSEEKVLKDGYDPAPKKPGYFTVDAGDTPHWVVNSDTDIPEPSTWCLLAIGLAALRGYCGRRWTKPAGR